MELVFSNPMSPALFFVSLPNPISCSGTSAVNCRRILYEFVNELVEAERGTAFYIWLFKFANIVRKGIGCGSASSDQTQTDLGYLLPILLHDL